MSKKPLRTQFYIQTEERADKLRELADRTGCASESEYLRRLVDVVHEQPEACPVIIGGKKS